MSTVNSFVGTLEDVLRFLDSYKNDLFYIDINPAEPPRGARQFDITTFPDLRAEQVLEAIHPGPNPPQMTPQAATRIKAVTPTPEPVTAKLECGMNIHPADGIGYPLNETNQDLGKVAWVRFPFNSSPVRFPNLEAAFQFYDPIIRAYNQLGVKIILVMTHEMFGEGVGFNWNEMNSRTWALFRDGFIGVADRVVHHYKDQVQAYEIWNEGDAEVGNPAAVHFPPREFAPLLDRLEPIIRRHAPEASILLGGLVRGPDVAVQYVREVERALGGRLPLDAIGYHPYGKGAPNDRTVFSRFGAIADDLRILNEAFPKVPLWLTEVGALGTDNPDFWDDAALYMKNLYRYLRSQHAEKTPVVVWYAWTDAMDTAQKTNGLVTADNRKKPIVYDTFFSEACKE